MPNFDKLSFDDFFDPSKGKNAFNEIIQAINVLNKELLKTKKIATDTQKVISADLNKAIKDFEKTTSTSSDAGKKQLEQLREAKKQFREQAQAIDKLKKEIDTLRKAKTEVNEVEKEANRLSKERTKLNAKLSAENQKNAKENAQLKLKQQELNKELKRSAKESLGMVDAYAKLAERAAKAKREAKNLAVQYGSMSKEARTAAIASNKLNDELKDIDKSLGDNQRNVGNYSSALGDLKSEFGSMMGAITPVGIALAGIALATQGIQEGVTSIIEINKQLEETETLTKLTGDSLKSFTAGVRVISKSFELEFKETLKTANILMKDFGISGKEATDLINIGLLKGANINDDYLRQLQEYSTQFKAAGVEASTLIEVVALGATEGIFDDKAADVVKEGGLRLREFTKATKDALVPLGELRNKQIQQAIASGDSFKAIQLVSKGLNEVKLSAKQTQGIITNVFGGPGEDAGLRFIKLLADVNTEQKDVLAGLTARQKSHLELLKVQEQVAEVQVEIAANFRDTGSSAVLLGNKIKLVLLTAFNQIINIFKPVVESFKRMMTAFQSLGALFAKFRKESKDTNKELTMFQKFIKIFARSFDFLFRAISKVIRSVIDLVQNNQRAKIIFEAFVIVIDKLFDALLAVPNAISAAFSAFVAFFTNIKKLAVDTFSAVGDQLFGILTFDPALLRKGLKAGREAFGAFGEAIAKAAREGWHRFDFADEVKADLAAAKEEADKARKEELAAARKAANDRAIQKAALDKEKLAKALAAKKKALQKEIDVEKLSLIKQRNEGLIDQETYDKKLEDLEMEHLIRMKAIQDRFNEDSLKTQQSIEEHKLDIKKQAEADELKLNQEVADAVSKSMKEQAAKRAAIAKEEADEKKRIKDQEEADRLERLNSPVANALNQVIQDRINNLVIQAGVEAVTSALQDGKTPQEALRAGAAALTAATIIRASAAAQAQGFHDGGYVDGYTGGGGEWQPVKAILHGKEHVVTHDQTDKYNMRGWSANDLDTAIQNDYFSQFAISNNAVVDQAPVIVQQQSEIDYKRIGQEVGKNIPSHNFKPLINGHFQHSETRGSKTINTIFKDKSRLR